MAATFYIFDKEADALTACKRAFARMAKKKQAWRVSVGKSKRLLNVKSNVEVDVSLLSDDDIDGETFPLFGYRNGVLNRTTGLTKACAIPWQRRTDGKWVVPRPGDAYVSEPFAGYDIAVVNREEYNTWLPEEEGA